MRAAVAAAVGVGALVLGGGVVYAATRPGRPPATGNTPAGAAGNTATSSQRAPVAPTSPATPLPAGSPQGLTASHATPTGWQQEIQIAPGLQGVAYPCLFGDLVVVTLPPGAHWRAASGSQGPASGTDAVQIEFTQPMTIELAWTDAHNTDQVSDLALVTGAAWAPADLLSTGDYVILAMDRGDFGQVLTSIVGSSATPVQQQEAAALTAAVAAQQSQITNVAEQFAALWQEMLTVGPWAATFGAELPVNAFLPGTPLPAWWPTDDTASATEYHALFRYIGPGVEVMELPVPVRAWRRVA